MAIQYRLHFPFNIGHIISFGLGGPKGDTFPPFRIITTAIRDTGVFAETPFRFRMTNLIVIPIDDVAAEPAPDQEHHALNDQPK